MPTTIGCGVSADGRRGRNQRRGRRRPRGRGPAPSSWRLSRSPSTLAARFWNRLNDRRGGGEQARGVASRRRIDPPVIDLLLGALRRLAFEDDAAVPALHVKRAPGAEVEDGQVVLLPVLDERRADQIGDDVVAG